MSSERTRRVIAIGAVIALLGGAALLDRGTPSAAEPAAQTPGAVAPGHTVSSAWYCAEGTSNAGGRADEVLQLSNVGNSTAHTVVNVFPGRRAAAAKRDVDVAPGALVSVPVSTLVSSTDPGVTVESTGGRLLVAHSIAGTDDTADGPCSPNLGSAWHFASGTTVQGTVLRLAVYNPLRQDSIVDISFTTSQGPQAPGHLQGVVIPAQTRLTFTLDDELGRQGLVGTDVIARRGRVVAEQSLVYDGSLGSTGIALSNGAQVRSSHWYFPVGQTSAQLAQGFSIANSGDADVNAKVRIRLEGGSSLEPIDMTIANHSIAAVPDLDRIPPGVRFSVVIEASGPVTAETSFAIRHMRKSPVGGVALSGAAPTGSRRWFVVPSRVGTRSAVLGVVVPGAAKAHLTVTLVRGADRHDLDLGARGEVDGHEGTALNLEELGVPTDATLVVSSDQPIVVADLGVSSPGITSALAIPEGRVT